MKSIQEIEDGVRVMLSCVRNKALSMNGVVRGLETIAFDLQQYQVEIERSEKPIPDVPHYEDSLFARTFEPQLQRSDIDRRTFPDPPLQKHEV